MTARNGSNKADRARPSRHKMMLAAACGSMIGAGGAQAGTVTESTDFSGDQNNPTVLPAGTNAVSGHVNMLDEYDYIRFEGLDGGFGSLEINYNMNLADTSAEYSLILTFRNSSLASLGSQLFLSASAETGSVNVTVPSDGVIIAEVFQEQDFTDGAQGTDYTLDFTESALVSSVPEPGSAAMGALSAAALLARRRLNRNRGK